MIQNFDEQAYLEVNSDVKEAIERGEFQNALHHLEIVGLKEIEQGLRKFHKDFEPFNEGAYIKNFDNIREDIKKGKITIAFEHFCSFGYNEIVYKKRKWQEGTHEQTLSPPSLSKQMQVIKEHFDEEFYKSTYTDLKEAGISNFLEHYTFQGWKEGYRPNDWFDPSYYLKTYNDIAQAQIEPLAHYVSFGKAEGREPMGSQKVNKSTFFDYLNLQTAKGEYHKNNVPLVQNKAYKGDLKLIAFYLPQFHPIVQNDEVWGKGFTEWTNVVKALPQFDGHYQPRFPGELGYYDLRLLEIQKRQIQLAKNYGLYGFCYHYYWFNGTKVLEKPLEQLLAHPELDFPFCVSWANENWTKKWDGLDKDVILLQDYSDEDDLNFIEDVSRLFQDPRYIRVDDKPLLMIYRPAHFPDMSTTVQRWRKWCCDNGIGEIYLVMTHTVEHLNPKKNGFDAATEFAPNSFPSPSIKHKLTFFNENYKGNVYDYKELIEISKNFKTPKYKKFRSICPSWDNEARTPGKGSTFHHASPALYTEWLEILLRYTQEQFKPEEQFIFINAWNEWGEGAYLEPDQKFGYSYLDATYKALHQDNPKNIY